ncbi:MAG: hypothetical protein HKL96_08680 [Phycisphaerales bacterium]|nr:hypothetical protein [Phycisphaerales bacterium]
MRHAKSILGVLKSRVGGAGSLIGEVLGVLVVDAFYAGNYISTTTARKPAWGLPNPPQFSQPGLAMPPMPAVPTVHVWWVACFAGVLILDILAGSLVYAALRRTWGETRILTQTRRVFSSFYWISAAVVLVSGTSRLSFAAGSSEGWGVAVLAIACTAALVSCARGVGLCLRLGGLGYATSGPPPATLRWGWLVLFTAARLGVCLLAAAAVLHG